MWNLVAINQYTSTFMNDYRTPILILTVFSTFLGMFLLVAKHQIDKKKKLQQTSQEQSAEFHALV